MTLSPWFIFLFSSAVVVVAAAKLAEYGDVIAVRTRLGGLLIGTVLLAGATSLPEIITSISSFRAGVPNLAAGNFFGSNMANMLLLAIADLSNLREPLLSRVALSHALTAALAVTLMALSVIFILWDVNLVLGWVGLDSLALIGVYFGGLWLIHSQGQAPAIEDPGALTEVGAKFPTLRWGLFGFGLSAAVLILAVPQLVTSSTQIAAITGLGTGFIGTALLGLITSLPELVTIVAALRIGAMDMAVGNLFGSNVFNMLAVGLADFFYTPGRFLGDIDPGFALAAMFGLLLTMMALVGNLTRVRRRIVPFLEVDAITIILVYLGTMYLLYLRGVGV
jgi:cation:H+ antiporter